MHRGIDLLFITELLWRSLTASYKFKIAAKPFPQGNTVKFSEMSWKLGNLMIKFILISKIKAIQ